MFSNDAVTSMGYQNPLLIFAQFFILGKIKIFLRRHQKKYEEIGSSSDIEMIFKSLKVSVLNDLVDNIETHLQQISKE